MDFTSGRKLIFLCSQSECALLSKVWQMLGLYRGGRVVGVCHFKGERCLKNSIRFKKTIKIIHVISLVIVIWLQVPWYFSLCEPTTL